MTWDFETDPDFQEQLDWIDEFVREEIEPLDFIITSPYDLMDPVRNEIIKPLQKHVQDRELWACHLGPDLGGPGYGQVKLALMNEILGRARCAPTVFGTQAPDTGNSEILAHFGTPEQKEQFLEPLLRNEIVSCYSMTEPQGGADPKVFQTTAVQDGDEWIINGEKWFSSNARYSTFLIVMVVTDPDNPPYQQQSMFLVPTDTPGVEIVRNVGLGYESETDDHGSHAYVRYENVRVPKENLLGPRGGGFVVAQTRLGGGRIHHAMRTSGRVQRIFDMMCERAISRTTQGELLSKKQMVQEMIADSWLEMEMFRLFVLRTAWRIDKYQDYKKVRKDISGVKAAMPGVYRNIATRALQIHGSLGVSWEMPFTKEVMESFHMGLADGPTEVHKVQVARRVLDDYVPCDDLFPSAHLPKQREAALTKYADVLERHLQNQ
ncbi:MAG: acyl-CoA dehydrogenase [Acidimicrobiaceae bacterium]|nr:acyl-CoA dehydrogenase [Acidimicrobiaceae bacterium]|tara:strand:+ start:3270 stop:4574 length:1305 start_codon:yes stop_codon:yes gene_type:complete